MARWVPAREENIGGGLWRDIEDKAVQMTRKDMQDGGRRRGVEDQVADEDV
jgi:hypothetical protein